MLFVSETKTIDDSIRKSIPGEYVKLSSGYTRYEIAGPKNGPVVVLVNGFSVPYYLWDKNFDELVNKGYRVLRYDLFGRGGSDRPNVPNNAELFRNQLSEIIDTVIPKNKTIMICAICMGSIIAADYVIENPSRVKKIALIGPAGIPGSLPNYNWLARIPLWGDYLMQLWGDQELISGLKKHLYRADMFPEYKEQYLDFLQYKGVKRSLLSTNRNLNIDNATDLYKKMASLKKSILLIWGIEDKVVPIRLCEKLSTIMPTANVKTITDAGHVANYEQPEKTNKLLVDFFGN